MLMVALFTGAIKIAAVVMSNDLPALADRVLDNGEELTEGTVLLTANTGLLTTDEVFVLI